MSQSQIPQVLQIQDSDVRLMLACSAHIGSKNISPTMSRYVWKRTTEGTHLIDLRKTWEKLVLAARVIVALENSDDVCAIALTTGNTKQVPVAQRAVLKFSQYVNCRNIAGRYTPGTFTNRIQSNFFEPRLLVVSDPVKDFQPILESSYVNMPVIAMADVDSPTKNIDIVIPCNTRSKYSVALMWWMLAREVLRLRGTISRTEEWNVLVDMFLYRDTSTEDAKNTEKKGGKIKKNIILLLGKELMKELMIMRIKVVLTLMILVKLLLMKLLVNQKLDLELTIGLTGLKMEMTMKVIPGIKK